MNISNFLQSIYTQQDWLHRHVQMYSNKWLAKIQRKSVSFFARLKNDIIYQYLQFWKPVDYLLDTEINSKFCMGSIFKFWQNNQWHIVSSKVIGRLAQLDVQFYWIQSFEIFD